MRSEKADKKNAYEKKKAPWYRLLSDAERGIMRGAAGFFVLCGICLLLTGFAFGSVKLRDDKLLIDLDKAIPAPAIGGYEQGEDKGTEPSDTALTAEGTGNGKQEPHEEGAQDYEGTALVTARLFEIRIKHLSISCKGTSFADAEALRDYLKAQYRPGDKVTLVDAYAESGTYITVKDMLDELAAESGFTYTEKQE